MKSSTSQSQVPLPNDYCEEILEATQDFVGIAGLDQRIIYLNPSGKELIGLAADEEVVGRHVAEFHSPSAIERLMGEAVPAAIHSGSWTGENTLLHRDGREIPVLQTALAHKDDSGNVRHFSTIIRDLSVRREMESELREVEARIRSIADSAIDYMMLLDLDGHIEYINRALPGLTFERIRGSHIEQYVPQELVHRMNECFMRVFESRSPDQFDIEYHSPESGFQYFEARVAPVIRDNQIVSLTITARDMAARIQADRKLRDSEERFRSIFEHEPECVKLVDSDGFLLDINPAGLAIIEADNIEQVRGASTLDLVDAPYRERVVAAMQQTLQGQPRQIQFEVVGLRGTRRWMDSRMVPIKSSTHGNIVLAVTRDITAQRNDEEQKRKLHEQLAHVTRLNTLGEMVAGIAHEVSQPLTAIANFASACSRTLKAPTVEDVQRAHDWTRRISEQTTRVHQIIKRLKNFARNVETLRAEINLNELVQDAVELVEFEARRRGVSIECLPADSQTAVYADRIEIQQVLVNLLCNALDAVERVPEPERSVSIQASCRGETIEIVCQDNGPGFPSDDAARIFDAFVTTKPNGMGMGLSICRTIVESHGGKITAHCSSAGTKFLINLPKKERDAIAA